MELWERSAALALLEDVLRGAADAGRIALVAGEAGIGKSTLAGARTALRRSRTWWITGAVVTAFIAAIAIALAAIG